MYFRQSISPASRRSWILTDAITVIFFFSFQSFGWVRGLEPEHSTYIMYEGSSLSLGYGYSSISAV